MYFVVSNVTNLYNPICSTWYFPVASRLFRNTYLRIDSITTNIRSTDSCIVDSLQSKESDTAKVCSYFYSPVVCDTLTQLIFGLYKPAKKFIFINFEVYEEMNYIKDFGLFHYRLNQPGPSGREMLLRGCIINGVLYGDTNTLVGLNKIASELPDKFSLSQNYPNPFNPSTKIKFQLPKLGFVKLTIFDILGEEIQVLVNQQLSPGTYEADFNSSNLPSGVYYYKIESEEFIETKKMVLIK
jgi:hypothetical protein